MKFVDSSISYAIKVSPKPIRIQLRCLEAIERLAVDLDFIGKVSCQARTLKFSDAGQPDHESVKDLIAWAQVQLEKGLENCDDSKRRKQKVWEVFCHLSSKIWKLGKDAASSLQEENSVLKQELRQVNAQLEEIYESVRLTEARIEGFTSKIKKMNELLAAKEQTIKQLKANPQRDVSSLLDQLEDATRERDALREFVNVKIREQKVQRSSPSTRTSCELGKDNSCDTSIDETKVREAKSLQARQVLEHELSLSRVKAAYFTEELQIAEQDVHELEDKLVELQLHSNKDKPPLPSAALRKASPLNRKLQDAKVALYEMYVGQLEHLQM